MTARMNPQIRALIAWIDESAWTPIDYLQQSLTRMRRWWISDAASWVTGEMFIIDGGQRLGAASLFRRDSFSHA